MQCPSCEKYFVRLDTHLRRSAVCRSILPLPSPSPPLPVPDSVLCDSVGSQPQAGEAAIFLTPLNSNSASQAPAALGKTTNNMPALSPLPAMKQRLILPRTTEGWNAANEHFNNILVPAVLGASSLSEKYIGVGEGGAGGAVAPPLLMDRFFSTAVIVIENLFSNLLRKHQNASQTILFQNFSRGKIPSWTPYCGFAPPLLYRLLPL